MFNLSLILNKYFYKDINCLILHYLIDQKYKDFLLGYYGMFKDARDNILAFCGVCDSGCMENVIAFLKERDLFICPLTNKYQYLWNNNVITEYLQLSYWNWGLRDACKKGHKNIAHLMIQQGATRCTNCRKSIHDH